MMESQESDLERDDAMLEWQIERYVLGDCGGDDGDFDIEAFEARLEQDLSLAERVAKAVDNLILLKQASKALPLGSELDADSEVDDAHQNSRQLGSTSSEVRIWRTLATLAATILLGLGIAWGIRKVASDSNRVEASADEMSQVAASWVALKPVSLEGSAEEAAEDWELDEDLFGAELGSDADGSDDWLYLGGQDYFLQASMSDYKAES